MPMNCISGENVFFSDLHHPGGEVEEIERLLNEIPAGTRRVFLIGDIFHFWVNDPDFLKTHYAPFLDRLRRWAGEGIQLFFIEGNRDFLASHYFEEQPWIDVLANPTVTELGGRAVYIGHGDELCWNDWAYQVYKSVIRSRPLRFLADHLPAPLRHRTARRLSQASAVMVAGKAPAALEIPRHAYESIIASGIDVIVHGHLHQTYQREYTVGGKTGRVLSFGWKDGKRNFIHFAG